MSGGAVAANLDTMEPRTGVWDQWCVLNDRPYSKEGKQALLDEANCRQIIENFAAQKDDLSCNIGHDKDRVVAFYNAMALIIGGNVVAMASHDMTVKAPQLTDLPFGDDASPPDDGIYWHRARLTPLAAMAKPLLRKTSPEFVSDGLNEHGDPIGYVAVGGAWTNYPFLKGCELNEYEVPMSKGNNYAARCYEEAGVGKDDDDKIRSAKTNAYWRGKHGAEFSKFESEAGVGKDDDDAVKMTKMMAYMAGKFGDLQITHTDDDKPAGQQMEDPVVKQGAPVEIANAPRETSQVPGAQGMTAAGDEVKMTRAEFQKYEAAMQQLPMMAKQAREALAAAQRLDAERNKQVQAQKGHEFVMAAWKDGCIVPFASETAEQAQGRVLHQYTTFGEAAAKGMLAPKGSYTVREMTAGPLSFSFTAPEVGGGRSGERPDEALLRLALEHQQKNNVPQHRFVDSVRAAAAANPGLYHSYSVQSRAALFEGVLPMPGGQA